jgi:hypothetical protein
MKVLGENRMEGKKHYLTNEHLMKTYSDNFSLALRAMDFARAQIASGRDMRLTEIFDTLAKLSPAYSHER